MKKLTAVFSALLIAALFGYVSAWAGTIDEIDMASRFPLGGQCGGQCGGEAGPNGAAKLSSNGPTGQSASPSYASFVLPLSPNCGCSNPPVGSDVAVNANYTFNYDDVNALNTGQYTGTAGWSGGNTGGNANAYYYFHNLTINAGANATFSGPGGPDQFLTVYVSGDFTVNGSGSNEAYLTTAGNVRFIVSGSVTMDNHSHTLISSGTLAFESNTFTTGNNNVIEVNYFDNDLCPGGSCVYTPGDPSNLLIITAGAVNFNNNVELSGGVYSNGAIVFGHSANACTTGSLVSQTSTQTPGHGQNCTASTTFTYQAASANALRNINICACPGNP